MNELRGVLSGKVDTDRTGMCGPYRVPFSASQVYQSSAPLLFEIGLDIGSVFAKCIIFDEFILWLTYRLSKSIYA